MFHVAAAGQLCLTSGLVLPVNWGLGLGGLGGSSLPQPLGGGGWVLTSGCAHAPDSSIPLAWILRPSTPRVLE